MKNRVGFYAEHQRLCALDDADWQSWIHGVHRHIALYPTEYDIYWLLIGVLMAQNLPDELEALLDKMEIQDTFVYCSLMSRACCFVNPKKAIAYLTRALDSKKPGGFDWIWEKLLWVIAMHVEETKAERALLLHRIQAESPDYGQGVCSQCDGAGITRGFFSGSKSCDGCLGMGFVVE